MKGKLSLSILIIASCLDNVINVRAELSNYGFDVDQDTDSPNPKSHVISDASDTSFGASVNDVIYQESEKDSQSYPQSKDLLWKRQSSGAGDAKVYGFWKKRSNQSGFWKRQSPKDATFGFWKREPHVDDVSGFWKRQYGAQDDDTSKFWKRSPESETYQDPWVSSSSSKNGVLASKRFYEGRPIDAGASFWKRGQPEMSNFWKRSGMVKDDSLHGFWKRGGVPWNLMMLPEYRDRLYKSDLGRFAHPAVVAKQRIPGLEPLPPMNRRRGPKHNPDFNPTGW